MSTLQKALQSRQIRPDCPGVCLVVVFGPFRLSPKGKHQLAAGVVGDHPHRVVEGGAIGQRDVVIEDEVGVVGYEDHLNLTHWRLGKPASVSLLDRTTQPGSPIGQVHRICDVCVDVGSGALNTDADVLRLPHPLTLGLIR
jgi:hypothetical protein